MIAEAAKLHGLPSVEVAIAAVPKMSDSVFQNRLANGAIEWDG